MRLIAVGLYRVRGVGTANVPAEGGALLVSNHVTRLDALLIGSVLRRDVRFVMSREIYGIRWLHPIFRQWKAIPISPRDRPRQVLAALKEARGALLAGRLVCIFAEGAMTRNGNLFGFRPGLEKIVRGTGCPVVPVFIGGAWGKPFSYGRRRRMPGGGRHGARRVNVLFGKGLPDSIPPEEAREAVLELGSGAFGRGQDRARTLPTAFVHTARRLWRRPAMWDTSGRRLTYGGALVAGLVLAGRLRRLGVRGEAVGIVLPPCVGAALANIGLSLAGRIPVNLNFTASEEAFRSSVRKCGIRTVITSKKFVARIGTAPMPGKIVFVEEFLANIGGAERVGAALKALFAPARLVAGGARPEDVATVIFSSGSTGDPKGVMLTHRNILSNIESFRMVLDFGDSDRMCGVLPLFHSFGFTCTLWCPLVTGIAVGYHPNPLDASGVGGLVRGRGLTVLLGTPSFLLGYARRTAGDDFRSLRLVVAGAERLSPGIADSFERKFGIRPLEGYGATECSPVIAVNVPDVEVDGVRQKGTEAGSVGQPVPGMAVRVVDPVSRERRPAGQTGLLLVKGPNVMKGYLDNAEETARALRDGWYDTGDLARVEADGFVFLVDRIARFSKIGGEMVPHKAVEDELRQGLRGANQAVFVTSAPDARKGEQLVVFFTEEAGGEQGLWEIMRRSRLPGLWKPRPENFVRIGEAPRLGSGKLDLARLKEMAREFVREGKG